MQNVGQAETLLWLLVDLPKSLLKSLGVVLYPYSLPLSTECCSLAGSSLSIPFLSLLAATAVPVIKWRPFAVWMVLWALEDMLAQLSLKLEPGESPPDPCQPPCLHDTAWAHPCIFHVSACMGDDSILLTNRSSWQSCAASVPGHGGGEKPISVIAWGVNGKWGMQIHPPQLAASQHSHVCPWCLQRSLNTRNKVTYECSLCSALCTDYPGNTSGLWAS